MRTLDDPKPREDAPFARDTFRVRLVPASLSFLLLCIISCWAGEAPFNSATISGLGARNIGSATMSGRISAIAGKREPSGKITLFVGAASGGVWKSDDSGTRYRPVFDEQSAQSIGAIALDPENSKNVWVGTGESWTRNSVSIGDGIYKSTDGGETWTHSGLEKSERIAKIAVNPKNGETVFAAVPGALWSDSPDRGLYKTTDGGKTWNQVLKGANLSTGCTDVAIDPSNPDIMFAAMWDFRRKGWDTAPVVKAPLRLQPVDYFVPQTAATLGLRLRRRLTKVFRRSHTDALQWQSLLPIPSAFTLLWNPPIARFLSPTMAARLGRSEIKANGWCGARSTLRT